MRNFVSCLVATSTVGGCVGLPVLIIQAIRIETGLTFGRLITDHELRDTVCEALNSVILALVTFTGAATWGRRQARSGG